MNIWTFRKTRNPTALAKAVNLKLKPQALGPKLVNLNPVTQPCTPYYNPSPKSQVDPNHSTNSRAPLLGIFAKP